MMTILCLSKYIQSWLYIHNTGEYQEEKTFFLVMYETWIGEINDNILHNFNKLS